MDCSKLGFPVLHNLLELAQTHVTCIYILDSLVRDSRKNNNPIAKSIPVLSSVVFKCHGGSEVKASAWNGGDLGLIPGSGRFPGEGMATHSSIPV